MASGELEFRFKCFPYCTFEEGRGESMKHAKHVKIVVFWLFARWFSVVGSGRVLKHRAWERHFPRNAGEIFPAKPFQGSNKGHSALGYVNCDGRILLCRSTGRLWWL